MTTRTAFFFFAPHRLNASQRDWLRSHRSVADAYELRWRVTLF